MNVQAMKNFRANLSFALSNRGISYRKFAEDSKLTFIYIYRICNPKDGKPEPSLEVCDKIAHSLGYELVDMLVATKQFKAKESAATAA
jgi:transcriptional regulator with XRE-family HTH domain